MDALVNKYADKLIRAGLTSASGPCPPLVGGLDDTLVWNRESRRIRSLEPLFSAMAITSLVYFRPGPPYDRIIGYLAGQALDAGRPIRPMDCETRTFLHDLPVVRNLSDPGLLPALKQRKSVIIAPGKGDPAPAILAHGTVSPEQGFVTASSVAFAAYVKFFTDYLYGLQTGSVPREMHQIYDTMLPELTRPQPGLPDLIQGPLDSEEQVFAAMVQAGKATVDYGLVDSYFGNISYCRDGILYISQTGSSLDELAGCIDPVPLDGSSSAGLTASSELTAHTETIRKTGCDAILHGHPKFCVIMSMDCDPREKAGCRFSGKCHIHCPRERFIDGVPIVPGEVGTGPTGLCNTLPPAFRNSPAVIVYGHGLFTTGSHDFSGVFSTLLDVETRCRRTYLDNVAALRA